LLYVNLKYSLNTLFFYFKVDIIKKTQQYVYFKGEIMHKNNRFFVVIGAIMIQICLGAIYSWSLYNQPLADKYGWDKDAIVMAYSIAIFVFAFTTIFSGRLYDKIGPKKVATIGGVLYGTGMILSAFATELWMLYITYGVLAGIGVGFAYVSPLSTCVKWFPHHKGFITGIAVGAFGSGSFVFKTLIEIFLQSVGVTQTFIYLGVIFMVLVVCGASLMKLPNTSSKMTTKQTSMDMSSLEMIKTSRFYYLWIMYLLGSMPGLLVIGLAKDIGLELVGLSPAVAASAVSIIALFNAGGRLICGTISDKLGRINVIIVIFIITIAALLTKALIPLNQTLYYICLIGVAFSFGGFLSVFPAITSELFGVKNLGANYGIIFQAYGISALIGPIIKSFSTGYTQTFLIGAGFGVAGLFLTLLLRKHLSDRNLLI
jgi:OFA family oxalate/formate antiporter-like MFS transporter